MFPRAWFCIDRAKIYTIYGNVQLLPLCKTTDTKIDHKRDKRDHGKEYIMK